MDSRQSCATSAKSVSAEKKNWMLLGFTLWIRKIKEKGLDSAVDAFRCMAAGYASRCFSSRLAREERCRPPPFAFWLLALGTTWAIAYILLILPMHGTST